MRKFLDSRIPMWSLAIICVVALAQNARSVQLYSPGPTRHVNIFTSNGTYTPIGSCVDIDMVGSGSGGGGGNATGGGGGGGGAGYEISQQCVLVTPGSALTMVIPAGGAGGAIGSNGTYPSAQTSISGMLTGQLRISRSEGGFAGGATNGGNGAISGNSDYMPFGSFGTRTTGGSGAGPFPAYISASVSAAIASPTGYIPGSNAGAGAGTGGGGGSYSVPWVYASSGAPLLVPGGANIGGGAGGNTRWGSGGVGGATSTAGGACSGYGSGGGGGGQNAAGGAGCAGMITITDYY